MQAVRIVELRCRLKLLTWQELAAVLPGDLQQFLAAKYGIIPATDPLNNCTITSATNAVPVAVFLFTATPSAVAKTQDLFQIFAEYDLSDLLPRCVVLLSFFDVDLFEEEPSGARKKRARARQS